MDSRKLQRMRWKAVKDKTNGVGGNESDAWGGVCDKDHYVVATIWSDIPKLKRNAKANAEIMALAPQMLAAILDYIAWGESNTSEDYEMVAIEDRFKAIRDKIGKDRHDGL